MKLERKWRYEGNYRTINSRGRINKSNEIETAMGHLFSEDITDSEISAFLIGLKAKGETVGEIAGLVDGIRAQFITI